MPVNSSALKDFASTHKKPLAISGALLFALLVALFVFGRDSDAPQVLETGTVSKGTIQKSLDATGIIKAQVGAIVKIGAQATGRITSMNVRVGQRVKEGDLIAVIDDRELRADEREALARLDRSRSELERVEAVYPLQILEATANLDAARAEYDYSKDNLRRQKRLFKQELIAKDTLDDAFQNSKVKGNIFRARQAAESRLTAEFKKEKVKAQKSIIEAEANLASIRTQLSYTRIMSPLTGVVSQVTAQEGETVVSGLQVTNLITVLDPTRLEMWIYVDETDIGQVEHGMPVEFQVDAYPNAVFHGTIDQVYPEPEIRDNIVYYQALVIVDTNTAKQLRPEMTTQCRIIVSAKDDVLTLPNAALKWIDGTQTVFLVNGRRVSKIHPKLGLAGAERTEILEGLSEGDSVATRLVLSGTGAKK
ncbi:efflux RND transporter periplasmic adaptor subunit [Desulfobaculum bizertense]|uniref:Membrane fusion protein, macrolide-specific efflux system n=1 Tax=Desulfobaculum bizertense DSM 18034 TaxID=1121442 RepID=A0A1T4VG72_9BACT|nr:efflux RND transporter periplasmic adaptor subunit [Desulfobaculum bizertense]UIJ37759.1 efflux RND transporter periplasmic adaptor subunit [Desulfobaculum bizertense]SKA63848.1 membrane fusion protein, macrolide-specific efflux system [Desulfobaculum bizertense DSM 18034]